MVYSKPFERFECMLFDSDDLDAASERVKSLERAWFVSVLETPREAHGRFVYLKNAGSVVKSSPLKTSCAREG